MRPTRPWGPHETSNRRTERIQYAALCCERIATRQYALDSAVPPVSCACLTTLACVLVKKEWVEVIFTDGHLTLQVSCITSSIPLERLHRVNAWAYLQRKRCTVVPDHVGWEEMLTLTTTGYPALQCNMPLGRASLMHATGDGTEREGNRSRQTRGG